MVPAAWVAGPRKVDHWRTLVRARAIENTVYVAAAGQPAPRYTGHSMVVDPLGDVLAEAGDGDEVLTRRAGPRGARRGPPYQPVAGQPASVTFRVVSSPAPRRRAARAAAVRAAAAPARIAASPRRPRHTHGCRSSLLGARRARRARRAVGAADGRLGPDRLARRRRGRVAAAYAWALAARTGGRPVLFGTLALVVGVAVLVVDEDPLRTGAAVMTCVVARGARRDGDGAGRRVPRRPPASAWWPS